MQAVIDPGEVRLTRSGAAQMAGPGVLEVLCGDAGEALLQPQQVLALAHRQSSGVNIVLAVLDRIANQQASLRQQAQRAPAWQS
ncbi:hypothetical protein D3C73_1407720 [compost metagenome]